MKVKAITVNDTAHYTIKPEDRADIQSIHTVYVYDCGVRVHCCELLPSYELRYLYTYIAYSADVGDERLDELESRYCHEGGDDTYMHCRTRIFDTAKDCGEFETMEEAIVHLQGNCPF